MTGANFICGTSVRRQEQSSPKGQSSQSQCRARLIGGPTRPETGIAPTRLQSHIRRQTFLLPTPSGQYHQAKVEIIRPQSQCQHGQLSLNMDAHQRHKNTYTRVHNMLCIRQHIIILPSSQDAVADWIGTSNATLAHHADRPYKAPSNY